MEDYNRAIAAADEEHDSVGKEQARKRLRVCQDYVSRGITFDPNKVNVQQFWLEHRHVLQVRLIIICPM